MLARDLRLVEGFWVYPQADLMTFFRSVATDLRSETPIYLVGFTATPARDTIGAAALYAGRIAWFDHHDWPPEDLESLRLAIGKENVHVQPGAGSSLPLVLDVRSRRSRFSDKLVELVTARFSLHDHERWGRVWWQRLGELASRPGDKRAAVEPLLVGRPSDLAHEATRAPATALPPEVDYVAGRDFRVVHFGGYTLVVVPVPRDLDLHLTARIARERYAAQLSVAHHRGQRAGRADGRRGRWARRSLDLGRLVSHLASRARLDRGALRRGSRGAHARARAAVAARAPRRRDRRDRDGALASSRRSLAPTANLVEIFSSVQGEGPHVGQSTLFVRFGECDLRCRWCDSPHTWQPAEGVPHRAAPGRRRAARGPESGPDRGRARRLRGARARARTAS